MQNNSSILNDYLVDLFNYILKIEEMSLQSVCNELSLSEMHTIEAIINMTDHNVGSIASKLYITTGTLSVALKTLENKGCILREKNENDRRNVKVTATEKGHEINACHQEFHHSMVNEIISCLSATELEILIKSLDKLKKHFMT